MSAKRFFSSCAGPLVFLSMVAPGFISPAFGEAVRPWIDAHGSLSTYGMTDVNSDIGNVNALIAGTGLSMDEVHGGLGLGVMFGIDLSDQFSIGVGYDRLYASSDVGDETGSIKYDFPANAVRGFGQYTFTGPGSSRAHIGGSAGLITEAGSVTVTVAGQGSINGNIEGSGGLFELFAGGDYWAAPQFALTGSAGYRYAKITENKIDGEIIYLGNGEKETIDYSGIYVRAGFKFALTK